VSDEPEDGSDWLSGQFAATGPAATQTPPVSPIGPAEPAATQVPPGAPHVQQVSPAAAGPAAAPPGPAAASGAPAGGFTWGLRPGSGEADPAPVQAESVVPPPGAPVEPVLPVFPSPATPVGPVPTVFPPPAAPVRPVAPVAPAAPSESVPSVPAVIPQAPAPTSAVIPPAPPPLVLPPAAPSAPRQQVEEPTKPLDWSEFAATQQVIQPPALGTPPLATTPLDQPTEAYTVQPWPPAAATSPAAPSEDHDDLADPTSAIDSLFGDHKFQEYEEVGVLKTLQVLPPSAAQPDPEESVPREPRAPLPTTQKVLMGVAGGLIGALILIGLFFFGQHLGSAQAAPAPKRTPGASATPTPAGTGGPAVPGVQQWTALQGGECIQPFTAAWAETFTVVKCTADHDAEMVFKGKLPDSSSAAYPTTADFQKLITPLCSAPTAINYAAAAAVTDLQVSFSYPPNTAAWLGGDRTYYCFVDRVSGGNLPGDLAVPKTPPAG
jgi:hypothetical protein